MALQVLSDVINMAKTGVPMTAIQQNYITDVHFPIFGNNAYVLIPAQEICTLLNQTA